MATQVITLIVDGEGWDAMMIRETDEGWTMAESTSGTDLEIEKRLGRTIQEWIDQHVPPPA